MSAALACPLPVQLVLRCRVLIAAPACPKHVVHICVEVAACNCVLHVCVLPYLVCLGSI